MEGRDLLLLLTLFAGVGTCMSTVPVPPEIVQVVNQTEDRFGMTVARRLAELMVPGSNSSVPKMSRTRLWSLIRESPELSDLLPRKLLLSTDPRQRLARKKQRQTLRSQQQKSGRRYYLSFAGYDKWKVINHTRRAIRQSVYEAMERMYALQHSLDKHQKSLKFRMGMIFTRLDDLLARIWIIYTFSWTHHKHWWFRRARYIAYMQTAIRDYFDIVYIVERIILIYTKYIEIQEVFKPPLPGEGENRQGLPPQSPAGTSTTAGLPPDMLKLQQEQMEIAG